MLFDSKAIDAAVQETWPDGLPEGPAVVGIINNKGAQAVVSIEVVKGVASVQGYYQHPWTSRGWLGGENEYGGRILIGGKR